MTASKRTVEWLKSAGREHWLPMLILVAPIAWVVYQADKAENVLPMFPLPLVAIVVGFALRPRHVWLLWLGAVVTEWIVVLALGNYNDPESGETLTSIMIESFIWMLIGVLIPLWIGRGARTNWDGNTPA